MKTPVETWVRACGGVAHSSAARAAGYSGYEMGESVRSGALRRVRRSWLVSPDCAPERRAAAEVSGRVTCVTAARMRGLWSEGNQEVHITVPATASRISARDIRLHWSGGPVPVARFAIEEPVLNVLAHVAQCAEPATSVAIWESALRKKAVNLSQLRRTAWHSTQVEQVLALVGTGSDSGIETRFLAIMRSCGVRVQQQVVIDDHAVDALIGDRLIVQLDGFAFHSAPGDRRRDLRQDARLALLGYTVLRFDYQQVMYDQEYVQQTVLNAVAQGLHRSR